MNLDEMTIKQRLAIYGYRVERVYRANGKYRGIRLIGPDGEVAHDTPLCDVEYGIDLLGQLESSDEQLDMFV
jgi:hypothetical protein